MGKEKLQADLREALHYFTGEPDLRGQCNVAHLRGDVSPRAVAATFQRSLCLDLHPVNSIAEAILAFEDGNTAALQPIVDELKAAGIILQAETASTVLDAGERLNQLVLVYTGSVLDVLGGHY